MSRAETPFPANDPGAPAVSEPRARNMNAETIARALGGRKAGGGGWTLGCPAHDARNSSLSIRDVGGKLLVRRHTGLNLPDDRKELVAKTCAQHAEREVYDTRVVAIANDLAGIINTCVVRKSRADNPSVSAGDCAHWHRVVQFRDAKARERSGHTVVDAPLAAYPDALSEGFQP